MIDNSLKIILIFLLLTSFLLPSCSKPVGDVNRGTALTIVDYPFVDRIKGLEKPDIMGNPTLWNLLFEPLRYDQDLPGYKAEDVLIRDISPSPDRMKWRIRLRDGIRFHDGSPLTASDILFSFRELVKSENKLQTIKSMRARDDLSLYMELYQPSTLINVPSNLIYAVSKGSTPEKPIGTGPFMFGRWLDDGFELTANDRYHEGRPTIDMVRVIYESDEKARLRKLLSGEADLMPGVSPDIADFIKRDVRFYLNSLTVPYHVSLFLNNESPFFKDREVRLALNMAVNRGRIIDEVIKGGGVLASGPFSQDWLPAGDGAPPYKYAPRESVRLLNEAGWHARKKDGILEKDGKRFAIRIFYIQGLYEYKKASDLIARDMFEVGIEARTIPMLYKTLVERYSRTGEYDAVLWIQQSASPSYLANSWQSPSLHAGTSENIARYSSTKVDSLLDEAQASPDREERRRVYAKIQKVLHDDAPAVFLYHPVYFSAVNKRFNGGEEFVGNPYSWHKIKDWTLR